MRIAFHAPLKAPDHPVPSGDRALARLLLAALAVGGHELIVASRLRTFDRSGDPVRQLRMRAIGRQLARRVARRLQCGPSIDLWFTYHVHHKAPDLVGPAVSEALRIPYVIAEASIAPRQGHGRWAEGYADALAAIRAADAIISLNPGDVNELARVRPDVGADTMAPFIDVEAFTAGAPRVPRAVRDVVRLVTVAMMRDGAKLASYRVLAEALAALSDTRFELRIAGDGPAREAVHAAFAAIADCVTFLGACSAATIRDELAAADLFVWPAVDEAFGIAFLEAQACAVPVIGAMSPGVAGVVDDGRTGLLVPMGDVAGFAGAVRALIADPHRRLRMGEAARAYVRKHHDLPCAAARLDAILRRVVATRAIVA